MDIEVLSGADGVDELMKILASYDDMAAEFDQQKRSLQAELSENGDNRTFFVGRIQSTPVAMVQLIHKNADNNPELANGRDVSHVHALRVVKELARQGLGRKLMEFVEGHAKSIGLAELTLGVDDWNAPAMNLYSSMGYQTFKEEPGRTPEEVLILQRKVLAPLKKV